MGVEINPDLLTNVSLYSFSIVRSFANKIIEESYARNLDLKDLRKNSDGRNAGSFN